MIPTFTIYTGPMYGSKTSRLIADIDRFTRQKRKILAFKPKIDDRYGESHICSHVGAKIEANCISSGKDLEDIINNELKEDYTPLNYVSAVDEAFMIDGIANSLLSVFKKGLTIVVSSIQLSANLKPFEEMQAMLPYATKVEVCPAVCPQTGEDAYYTFSNMKVGHDPVVGGEGMYEPRSFHAHPALNP